MRHKLKALKKKSKVFGIFFGKNVIDDVYVQSVCVYQDYFWKGIIHIK